MCISVIIGKKPHDTRRELRSAISTDLIFFEGSFYDAEKEDYCLCGVNLIKTAETAGMDLSWDDWGDVVLSWRDQ